MPFLIEVKDREGRWVPAAIEPDQAGADRVLELAGLRLHEIRATELDQARINFRFAKAVADRLLREYLAANARAYNLKIKIRPEHWPESMKEG